MIQPSRTRENGRSLAGRTTLLLLAVSLAGLSVSCGPPAAERDPGPEDDIRSGDGTNERGDSVGPERGVDIRRLVNDPEELYGERVTVSATVARVVQPRAFTLVSDEPESDEEPVEDRAVLVVSGEPVASGLSEEQSVRVSGEVRPFKLQEIEQQLGTELRDSLRASYGGETPAILADSVSSLQGG